MSPIPIKRFGPTTKGAVDGANSILDLDGVVRYARNAVMDGAFRLMARPGTQVAMTFMDDQGPPAECTSVVAVVAFGDGCLVVAHSTITQKFYLYWLDDQISGWYSSTKVLTVSASATPVGVLWTAASAPAAVTIAEGLGIAYIAHANAGTSFKTMKFDTSVSPATLAAFQANLNGGGLADTYFRGVVSFQQHLWGWGYGSQTAGDNDRPELLRFSTPFFGAMAQSDSIGVGHRVRSQRERVVAAVVAGEVLYVGTNYSLWPVTGFGRNSWDKSRPIDDSYGFAGIFSAAAARDGWLYYWSHRGPLRGRGLAEPEPLWEGLPVATRRVVSDTSIVTVFDPDRDQVLFLYQNDASNRVSVLAAYDTLKDIWLGPDGDLGLGVRCAALVQPTLSPGPAGPPTGASTDGIGNTVATAHWTNGDSSPGTLTQIEYRVQGTANWTVATSAIPAGQTSYQLTGLASGTAYEWRAKHVRNGQSSTYLGPVAGSQFTTATTSLSPPTDVAINWEYDIPSKPSFLIRVTWRNSGESGVSTEIHLVKQAAAPPSGTLPLVSTVGPGISSYYRGADSGDTWWVEIRHTKTGVGVSAYAPVGGPISVDVG